MDKNLSNLGLCKRAGYVITGTEMVCEYMASGRVKYIFLASDASNNTKKKIINKANYYNVEVYEGYSSLELSHAVGKVGRMVIGITSENFVKILKK